VKPFIGSSVAIVVGAFSVFSGLHSQALDNLLSGITTILGALAYRSAKRRRLALSADTRLRRGVEITLLVVVWGASLVLSLKGVDAIVTHPWSRILVPVWSTVA
jgi:hypothetical protein